ncbi:MAG: SBBP repeat-containing protein [Bacillota bacterium]
MRVGLIAGLVFFLACAADLMGFPSGAQAAGSIPDRLQFSSAGSAQEEMQVKWKAAVLKESGFSGIMIYVNNTPVTFDVQPRMVDGRVLVPVRKVSEALGAAVSFNGMKVILRLGSKNIELTIDSAEAIVNGRSVRLDAPAAIADGRTLVPLRFISENLDKAVYFAAEGETYVINIVDQTAPVTLKPKEDTTPAPSPVNSQSSPAKRGPASFSIGSPYSDWGKGIASDGKGNVYVAGYFSGTADFDPGPDDYKLGGSFHGDSFLAKYDSGRNLVWAVKFGNTSDMPNSFALDREGNIYITGFFRGKADFDPGQDSKYLQGKGNKDCYLAKYSNDGKYLWAIGFGSERDEESISVAVDSRGNAYVTGHFSGYMNLDPSGAMAAIQGRGFSSDIFVASYDKNGRYRWGLSAGGEGQDQGQAIAVDGSGNCYVAGFFEQTASFNAVSAGGKDAFLAKYNSGNGELVWAKSLGGSGNDQVAPGGMALDGKGNIYLTGDFSGVADFDPGSDRADLTSKGQGDIFVAKYDSSGNYLWAVGMGDTASDGGQGIAVDQTGQVYVSGWFWGTVDFDPGQGQRLLTAEGTPAKASDFFLAKYGPGGNFQWALSFGGRATSPEDSTLGTGLAVDPSGGVVATGCFYETVDFDPGQDMFTRGSNGGADIFVVRYDEKGNLR